MGVSRKSISLLVGVLLLTMLLPAVPAAARPRASRRALAPMPLRASIRTLAADDDFPGVPIPASPFSDSVDEVSDEADVFQVHLEPGDTLEATLSAGIGEAVMLVFQPNASAPGGIPTWENDLVGFSEGPGDEGLGFPQILSFTAGTSGTYYLMVLDIQGTVSYALNWEVVAPPISMKRVAGKNRYETALAISKEAFADGSSPNVILAQGAGYADALAASALAGSYDCPILLTPPTSLANGVIEEIDRLRGGATANVMIVGGPKSVSDGIAGTLTAHGGIVVKRIKGNDRYGTAIEIGKEVRRHETADLGHSWTGEAFVTRGNGYADALAAAPIAFARKMPVVLVAKTSIPGATAAGLPALGLSKAYVLGDTASVDAYVASHLGVPVERFCGPAGTGRMETAANIASQAVGRSWANAGTIGITTGWAFPDALGGGSLIGKMGGVMLLTKPDDEILSDTPWQFVYDHQTSVANMRALGSKTSVPDLVFPDFLGALEP